MDELIKLVIAVFGTQAITIGLVGYFVHLWFKRRVEQDLERFKSDLQRLAIEHEVRFRRVDEKVAERLSEVYGRLQVLFENVHSYVQVIETDLEPTKDEKFEAVKQGGTEFIRYIVANRLYVPPTLYLRSKRLGHELLTIAGKLHRGLEREKRKFDPDRDPYGDALEAIDGEVNALFNDLVAAFQKKIGVVDE